MDLNLISEFQVVVYGNLEKYNETISKARCRIFYKKDNRNGTYITDEFAEKLISTLPYTPVKGIYEQENGDYSDHGTSNAEGRIYGIVPENPNFAWEEHEDVDGIVRTYACADVLIFTGLYTEASSIVGKPQSMELYAPSIKGDWKIINGKKFFVFEDASFLGLQVLGNEVEPCFQGAAFFSLVKDMEKALKQMQNYNLNLNNGGKQKMRNNFKLSDDEKYNAIWDLLNVRYNEENDYIIDYMICNVYDDYAVVFNFAENIYERVYYVKNDDNDSLEITKKERCYIIDVNEEEKNSLNNLYSSNNFTYENLDINFTEMKNEISTQKDTIDTLNTNFANLKQENEQKDIKITDYENSISTLNTDKVAIEHSLQEAQKTIDTLTEENIQLKTFKSNTEYTQKMEILDKFSSLLDSDTIASFNEKVNEFTCDELSKELSYVLVKNNQSVFTAKNPIELVLKEKNSSDGIEQILSRYHK